MKRFLVFYYDLNPIYLGQVWANDLTEAGEVARLLYPFSGMTVVVPAPTNQLIGGLQ